MTIRHTGFSRWESRYQAGDMRWDKGAPAPGLVDFLAAHPKLPRGTVLVPGCGTGHDVRAFAAAGFKATGLDFASSAVALAKARTQAAGLRAQFLRKDFLRGKSARRFDWLFEHTLFCAISPEDRAAYVRAVLRCLKPGGQFLAIHYMIPTEGDEPPFGVTRRELWERFAPHFELLAEWTPRSYPNRVGLEQMLWWRQKGCEAWTSLSAAAHPRGSLRPGEHSRPHPGKNTQPEPDDWSRQVSASKEALIKDAITISHP